MPQRDPGIYLEDIEHYAAAAVRFTSGFSLEQYLADEKTRAAVERVLEVCGEAMSNLYRTCATASSRRTGGVEGVSRSTITAVSRERQQIPSLEVEPQYQPTISLTRWSFSVRSIL